jgi:DNA-binding response OmpR family regulator
MTQLAASPAARVLVVEDDRDIAALVAHYLGKAGYRADILYSGADVLRHVREGRPAVIVLDLMLPGVDGLEICRALRGDPATTGIPIIMVTARGEESERILGLELGADDYLTKPFSPQELVARVRAVLRRAQGPTSRERTRQYGPIAIDPDRHVVLDNGREVRLTAKEFMLLDYLVQHRGRVLSRDLLLSDVWGYRYTGGTRTVDVHVRRLREKLPFLEEALVTVKQFGYKLSDPAPRSSS